MSLVPTTVKPAKYLVCVDQRDESHVALRLACMKSRVRNGSVEILHVVPPGEMQALGMIADKMREEQLEEASAFLKRLADKAEENYGVRPQMQLREGAVGDEIVAAAMEDTDLTMIVIGTAPQSAGRGHLSAWLATQLGDKLLIPLLLVPGNLTDYQLENLV